MKLSFIIFLFLISIFSIGQTKRVEYQVFNAKGKHYLTYVKLVDGNTTSYTSYYHNSNLIKNITIRISEEDSNFKRYIYEYSYTEDTSQIKKAKSINKYVKKNDPTDLVFKTRETWTYYAKNDSLFRYDLSEYNPSKRGIPRFSQIHYVNYSDSLIKIDHYFVKFTNFEKYASDSIIVGKENLLLTAYYLRWENPRGYTSQLKDSIWSFGYDSIKYSDVVYEYDNQHFWKRLYNMTGGEGAIYHFDAIAIDEKLTKWRHNYVKNEDSHNEFEYDSKGRIIKIISFKQQDLIETFKIIYH